MDRLMRIDMADLQTGVMAWEVVNAGDGTAIDVEGPDEALRRADTDYAGAWLEEPMNGAAAPFPSRSSPGNGIDTYWLGSWGQESGYWAAIPTTNEAWLVAGLADPWSDSDGDLVTDAEEDTLWYFWPDVNPDGHSFQTASVQDVAIDSKGMAWAATGDLGLTQSDLTRAWTWWDPAGAAIDCLWDGYGAGGNSVAVTDDGSVWLTFLDQSSSATASSYQYYPQEIGVARTLDQGVSWSYAGGALDSHDVADVAGANRYARVCINRDETYRTMSPFAPGSLASARAFLTDSTYSGSKTDLSVESFGSTSEVEAIDANTALVWFRPRSVGGYPTEGGLYLTANGGVSWTPVPFDGSWDGETDLTDDCTAKTTFGNGAFEIVHPGADSAWFSDEDGVWDADLSAIRIVVGVPQGGADDDGNNEECAFAVVHIHPDPAGTATLEADWDWIALPTAETTGCAMSRKQLVDLAVPRWGNEVAFWGGYARDFGGGAMTRQHGGACIPEPGHLRVFAARRSARGRVRRGRGGAEPELADLYAVVPGRGTGGWQECQETGTVAPTGTVCPDAPLPRVYWRTNTGWTYRELADGPPSPRINGASWSPIGAGGSDTTWLGVATGGSGMWVGKVTW